jgi:hypothetical protein
MATLHATGVPQPQQISVIVSKTQTDRWMLAGFSSKPMIEAGHDGLWYWTSARKFAQTKMSLNAWLYDRKASNLFSLVSFHSSSNLEKLQKEIGQIRPGMKPISLNAFRTFSTVTAIDTTTGLGNLGIDIEGAPDAARLRNRLIQRLRGPK